MYISDRPIWDLGEHPSICLTFVILINVFYYVEVMTRFEGGSFALPPQNLLITFGNCGITFPMFHICTLDWCSMLVKPD